MEGSYVALGAIAKLLGVPYRGDRTLVCDLGEDRLTLDLMVDSSVVRGVTASVFGGPYPEIRFRKEKPEDLEAKDSGLSREVQIGDADFDARVYIETDAPDEAVREVVDRNVRDAVLDMLDVGCNEVRFRARGVEASIENRTINVCEPNKLKRVVDSLRSLARTAPLEDHTRRSSFVPALFLATVPGVVVAILAHSKWMPRGPALSLIGLAIGLVLGALARPLVRRAVAGTSTSLRRLRLNWSVTIALCAQLACGLAVALNGALDSSPSIERDGAVTAIQNHETEGARTKVTVTWSDGSTETILFHDHAGTLVVGALVHETHRRGKIGFAWGEETHAKLGPNVWPIARFIRVTRTDD